MKKFLSIIALASLSSSVIAMDGVDATHFAAVQQAGNCYVSNCTRTVPVGPHTDAQQSWHCGRPLVVVPVKMFDSEESCCAEALSQSTALMEVPQATCSSDATERSKRPSMGKPPLLAVLLGAMCHVDASCYEHSHQVPLLGLESTASETVSHPRKVKIPKGNYSLGKSSPRVQQPRGKKGKR